MKSPRLMPAKVRLGDTPRDGLADIRKEPPSPERTTKVVDRLEADIARFPVAAGDMPAEVAAAHGAFLEAVQTARSATDAVIRAHAQTADAEEADIRQTADALRAGTKPPALTQTKARAYEDTALVALQASERIAAEAHVALTDSIHSNWAAWRRAMVTAADEQHEKTMRVFSEARAAVEARRAAYAAVTGLDNQVVGRYPDDVPMLESELRNGLPWFDSAVRPYLPGGWNASLTAKIVDSLDLVDRHLRSPIPWVEWSPPGDPDHDALLAQPVDPDSEWVRRAVTGPDGMYCVVCNKKLPADTPLHRESLAPVHVGCPGKPPELLPGPGVWSGSRKEMRVR